MPDYTEAQHQAMANLETAVQEYLAALNPNKDEALEFLGDWYLVGEILHPERRDASEYFRCVAGGGLPIHRVGGLLDYAMKMEYLMSKTEEG